MTLLLTIAVTGNLSCNLSANASDVSYLEVQEKNKVALENAQLNIEKVRKNNARIKILDTNGKPLNNLRIKIRQISHDFKFGCYLKIDDLETEKLPVYENRFSRLFNFAIIGNYWDFIENKENAEDWTWFDRELSLAQKLNLRTQTAPILWGTNQAGTPSWLPKNKEKLQTILKSRIENALNKAELVDEYEVVNEPLAKNKDFFAQVVGTDYVETAFRQARELKPNKRLMLNEYGVFGELKSHNYNREKYFLLIKDLISKNVPIDIIGLQAHANGEWFEPANVAEQLEKYATLGKPIQITEFSSQTLEFDDRKTPLKISGLYQRGTWTAEKQAEFYREFYTIAFGNSQVEAIVTWGLDDERAWLPGIGLIDGFNNPKPSYEMLERLINKDWKTSVDGFSNALGIYDFRGFYGKYEVDFFFKGKKKTREFELRKDRNNEWVITL